MRLPDHTGANTTGTMHKSGSVQLPQTGDKISLFISPADGSSILGALCAVRGTGSVSVILVSVDSLGDTSGILHLSADDVEEGAPIEAVVNKEQVEPLKIVEAVLTVLGAVDEFIIQVAYCV